MTNTTTTNGSASPPGRRSLLGLPLTMAEFDKRGFRLDRPQARAVLETAGRSFLTGFNLEVSRWRNPHDALSDIPEDQRGFAYEGAAQYAALLDLFTAGRAKAFARLLAGAGDRYVHLVHIGAGWWFTPLRISAMVRLPRTPLFRWLALDGNGFGEVYFGGIPALLHRARRAPSAVWEAKLAGCGRALWFVQSADPDGVEAVIAEAPKSARPHLWAGVGLACAYAGAIDDACRERLIGAAGRYSPYFAQGVVFAALARVRAGNVPHHTERACAQALGMNAQEACLRGEEAGKDLHESPDVGAYLELKSRVRSIIDTHC